MTSKSASRSVRGDYLHIDHVDFSYSADHGPVISDLSVTFGPGWTGVVGANGVGKSTLLKLATGMLQPVAGSVGPAVLAANSVYCAQDSPEPPEELFDLLGATDADSTRLISTLGIRYEWPWRWATLSKGEQKRAQIGAAIGISPAVLALDEPDTHLDGSAQRALLAVLRDFDGIGLVVGHDRAFLDDLCDRTVFVRGPERVTLRPGGVSAGLREEEREEETRRREWTAEMRRVERLKREAHRRSVVAAQQDARRSRRNLDRRDSDGRARIGLAIFTGKDGHAGQLKARLDRRLEWARASMNEARPAGTRKRGISISSEPSRRDRLVELGAQRIALGSDRHLEVPDLVIGPCDRVGVFGDNGAGKTTIVARLVEELTETSIPDRWFYLPQELSPESRIDLARRVKRIPREQRGEIVSILSRLDSDPARVLASRQLSPGEARKLMIAEAITDELALLVMDEPTNHLDLPAILELESAVKSFRGALCVVSHDMRFLEATCDTFWHVYNGRIDTTAAAPEGR
jgi:ATPase subunit of ABC transporter with duplicated ATPase domains